MPREYASAEAFRRALEGRLNSAAEVELIQVNRLRRQVAFDRLLARLFRIDPAPWALKGGYALELRFHTARATVDIDLTVQRIAAATEAEANQIVRDMLQDAVSPSLGDWFDFTIGPPVMGKSASGMPWNAYSPPKNITPRPFFVTSSVNFGRKSGAARLR